MILLVRGAANDVGVMSDISDNGS